MMRTRLAVLLGAASLLSALAVQAQAQSALVDYESDAKAAQIREQALARLAVRPPLQVLEQTVAQLRSAPGVPAGAQNKAGALLSEAGKQSESEARRTLWRAVVLLTGHAWSAEQETLGALALRTPSPVWAGEHETLDVAALYPAQQQALTYTLDLYASQPTSSATPKRGALIGRVGAGALNGAYPVHIPAPISGVADGSYLLVAEVKGASGASTRLEQPVFVVRDLNRRRAAVEAALKPIAGHEDAKWLAEYPYELAAALRDGRREVISYDFPRAMQRSAQIVAALKAGRDPVWRATGLQDRAYAFSPTGELVPYQLYVPRDWTPGRRWPLVVALHGANLDETNMLGRDGGQMQALADRHRMIVVAPLGYRLNSAYGSQRGLAGKILSDDERRRRSEQDVLQVMAHVEAEYDIDPARRYLTGNSMGGGGTWWIGGTRPELWAAIAPAAYGGVLPEDVPALKRLPILAVVGDHDELGMLDRVRASVATLRAGGAHPEYLEIPGGTHKNAYDTALPRVFDFFDRNAK